jgi:hypothetical protein
MATKKISELPLVNKVSGSQVAGGSVLPIVIGGGLQGTTNQISVEDFSAFVTAYSAHTGSAGNTFTGPQTINNNVTINGKLIVNELVATYETASVIYSEGGNIFGNELTDKQQLTGSVNITGSLIYNNVLVTNIDINTVSRLQQTTQSLQFHSASVDAQLQRLQQTTQSLQVATASLQFHSASVDAQLLRLQQTTQSLQVATASLQAFSSSVNEQLQRVYQTTQSLHVATASLQFHSASVDAQLLAIQQTTQSLQVATASLNAFSASTNAHIVGISDFTSSQLTVNLGNAIYTASVDSHIVGISTYTSSVRDTLARVHQATQSLQVATASLQQFTASQDSRNFVISQFTSSTNNHIVGISTFTSSQYDTMARVYQTTSSLQSTTASLNAFTASQDSRNLTLSTVTGSLIGITNGLMAYTSSNETWKTGVRGEISGIEAWTASLDNIYATDAQLTQLYQATRSIELHSGSMVGITNGLMAYTSSNETWKTGIRGEISGIEAWTASLDNTYATDAQLYPILQATRSLELLSGSLVGITNRLMALTASINQGPYYIPYNDSNAQLTNYEGFTFDGRTLALLGGYQGTPIVKVGADGIFTSWNSGSFYNPSEGISGDAVIAVGNVTKIRLKPGSSGNISLNANNGNIELTGSAYVKNGIYGQINATNNVVSSSQQITNYYKFAETASANTFYGDQTITGSLAIKDSETNFLIEGNGFSQTYLTSNGAIVLNPGYGGVEMVGSYRTFKATDITADGFVSGEIRATNNVVSSSQQIRNYSLFAVTSSANTFYGAQTFVGNLTASGNFTNNGTTQIGTSTTDVTLGSKTKLKVVGDGNTNAAASQGSMFVQAGVTGGDTGLPVNMGTAGASMMLLASINTSTGTSTNSAQYLLQFYFDGNNLPNVMYITGSSNFATFSVTSNNTLAISGSSSGNKSYAWWINKFGA